jgi:adenylate cyclase
VNDDFRRRLAAVLCADVAGYTRLMAGDESATHAAYKACLNDVVVPALEARRGRIVKSTGDGFIAVFDSVIDAVACALDIQDAMKRQPSGSRLTFRIGVNSGDIIVEDEDVYGDGVNIAARLQTLASPGGVCVSTHVRDQIGRKLPLYFESLGRKRVKKNDVPLRAYAVRASPGTFPRVARFRIAAAARLLSRKKRMMGLAVAVIGAGVFAVSQASWSPVARLASILSGAPPPLPLPDRPSLVVLPFKTIGSGNDQDYFADGITEDLITDLAHISGLFVIARNSSFAYKTRPTDVRKIGSELGVRYALDGSVRRSGDMVRIDAQLVDAQSGGHVWAARFDQPLGDIFKIQDDITQKIVTALSASIGEPDSAPLVLAQTSSMAAYDAYLRGWASYRRNTFADYQKSLEYFQTAIALDPGFSQAHAAIAAAYLSARIYSWTRTEPFSSPLQTVLNARRHDEELLEEARQHLGVALRHPTSLAYRVGAEILIFERKHDEAIEEIRKAIALDPSDADNFALLSSALVWAGKAEAAIEPIQTAMRLNPFYPAIYQCHYGMALFSLARYREAEQKFERCRAGNPDNNWPDIYLIAIYAYLGENGKVAGARKRVTDLVQLEDRSPFTVKEIRNRVPYRYQADLLRLLVGLHKGNVPDSLVQGQ